MDSQDSPSHAPSSDQDLMVYSSNLIFAGFMANIAFEIYAWVISPALFNVTLQPARMIVALADKLFGMSISYTSGFLIHFMIIGLVIFPVSVLALRKITKIPYAAAGIITGILLWFFAQGALAPLAGRSFMMDFGAYTQSSFIGHIGMTMIIAWRLALCENPKHHKAEPAQQPDSTT